TYINEEDFNFTVQEFAAALTNSQIISSYGSTLYAQVANGTLTDGDEAVYEVGGQEYTSYLVFNTVEYGYIHTAAPTTALTKIAISDPAYYLPAVRINAYQEDGFVNPTPKAEFNIDGTGAFLNSEGTSYPSYILGIQTLKGSVNLMID